MGWAVTNGYLFVEEISLGILKIFYEINRQFIVIRDKETKIFALLEKTEYLSE